MPTISSAIAGWLLVKTRLGSLPGDGNLPIETVTALNAKTAVQRIDVPFIYRGGGEAKVGPLISDSGPSVARVTLSQ
jgi:hypothetical protein